MEVTDKPLVVIRCLAFNQEKYIRQCLEGFVSQETDFPFVAIVHDDASTDGTADIIREYESRYPDIILPIYETENQYSKHDGSLRGIMQKAVDSTGAKYIAFCEGDDYWTDTHKLQKQCDFMEAHPECSLTYHACRNLYEDGYQGINKDFGAEVREAYSFADVLADYSFQTATTFYKSQIAKSPVYTRLFSLGFSFGDTLIYLAAAHEGRLMGINECWSVYRRTNSGVSAGVHSSSVKVTDTQAWLKAISIFDGEERKTLIRYVQFKIKDCYNSGVCTNRQLMGMLFSLGSHSLMATVKTGKYIWKSRMRELLHRGS